MVDDLYLIETGKARMREQEAADWLGAGRNRTTTEPREELRGQIVYNQFNDV